MTGPYAKAEVVRLLIERYPEGVHKKEDKGDAALREFVSAVASVEAVKELLEWGNAGIMGEQPGPHPYPLRMAVRHTRVDTCISLMEVGGADPRDALRTRDGNYVRPSGSGYHRE